MIKKILERRSEKVNDEDVVQTLLSEVVDIGDTGCDRKLAWKKGGPVTRASSKQLTASDQDLVRPVLITQLGSITLARFLFRSASR